MSGPGNVLKVLPLFWARASQESSHVGHAGVGVTSMRGAHFRCLPLPLLSLGGFLIAGGRCVACYLLLVVSCTWLYCTGIRC